MPAFLQRSAGSLMEPLASILRSVMGDRSYCYERMVRVSVLLASSSERSYHWQDIACISCGMAVSICGFFPPGWATACQRVARFFPSMAILWQHKAFNLPNFFRGMSRIGMPLTLNRFSKKNINERENRLCITWNRLDRCADFSRLTPSLPFLLRCKNVLSSPLLCKFPIHQFNDQSRKQILGGHPCGAG